MKGFENANFEIIKDFRMILHFCVQVKKKQIRDKIHLVHLLKLRVYMLNYKFNLDKYMYV